MSRFAAWDAATWIWACLCCLMILLGVARLLGYPRVDAEPARAGDWDLRYGGGADLAPARTAQDRLSGVVFVGLGLLQLLTLRPHPERAPFDIGLGVFIAAVGLLLLLFGPWFAAHRRRRHEARVARRLARGEDAYFEELRELQAYPPPKTLPPTPAQYLIGVLLIVLGGALIAANLNR